MARELMHLKIGDVAPAFALQTSDGREIRLTDVLRFGVAIIVFIRGTW